MRNYSQYISYSVTLSRLAREAMFILLREFHVLLLELPSKYYKRHFLSLLEARMSIESLALANQRITGNRNAYLSKQMVCKYRKY